MQDARHFQFSSDYPMAYFIYKNTVQITVPGSSGGSVGHAEKTVAHNLSCTPLPVGYWSQYSDFRTTNPLGSTLYGDDLKELVVIADDTNFYILGSNGSSSSITLYARLWAYAPPDAAGDFSPVSDSTKYNLSTDYEYLEIYQAGYASGSGNDPNMEIVHNLGYIPQCAVWRETYYSGKVGYTPAGGDSMDGEYSYNSGPIIDKNKLHLGGGDFYYHIYVNEA